MIAAIADERLGRAAAALIAKTSETVIKLDFAVFRQISFDARVVVKMRVVSREDIPDLPNRVVAATDLLYAVPVLNCGDRIRSWAVQRSGRRG